MTSDDRTRISPALKSADVGTQLSGIYELDQRLASGGMGEVFRGHNIQTGDKVAIKIVLPEFARDQTILSLFRKEASILNRLSHDAIVRYHVFTIDPQIGRPYLAMEFVDGESVFDVIRRGPMAVEDVRRLCYRLASGLSAAHEAGTIHRDLSPDNVILPGGRVDHAKIIDFGIARSATVGGETLIGGKFAGKYNYVSPEQLGLHGGEVSEQSDIYSLGLVLAAALRGKPLDMTGSQLEIVEKRRAVPDLSDIDPNFRPIIDAMLQSDPRERPASMAEIARATRAIEAPSPTTSDHWTATPRTHAERAWSESTSSSGATGTGFVQHIPASRPQAKSAPVTSLKGAAISTPRKSRFKAVALGGVAALLVVAGAGAYSAGVLDPWLAPAGPPETAPALTKAKEPTPPDLADAGLDTPASEAQPNSVPQETKPQTAEPETVAAAAPARDPTSVGPAGTLPETAAASTDAAPEQPEAAIAGDRTSTENPPSSNPETSGSEAAVQPEPTAEVPRVAETQSKQPLDAAEKSSTGGDQMPGGAAPETSPGSETAAEAPSPSAGAETRVAAEAEVPRAGEKSASTAPAQTTEPADTVVAAQVPAEASPPVAKDDVPEAAAAAPDQAAHADADTARGETPPPATAEKAEPANRAAVPEAAPAEAELAPAEAAKPAATPAATVRPDDMPPPFEDEEASTPPKPASLPKAAVQNGGESPPAGDENASKVEAGTSPTVKAEGSKAEEQIAMNIPKPDIPATDTIDQMAQQVSWLENFSGGDCFYATATSVTDKAIAVEGFGTGVDPFMTLLAKFQDRFKMEPDVGVRLIEPAQCEVTQFLHALGGNVAEKPSLSLDRTSVPNGFPISGTLETLGGLRTSLLLVDHKGMVFNLDSRIRVQDGKGIFSIPIGLGAAEQAAGKAVPQLLIAVTAQGDIEATALAKPAPVGEVLPAILDEVRQKGLEASAVAKYFQLGG